MKILIVEDDKKLALTYKNILSNTFDVYSVNSIKECKNLIKSGNTDVILVLKNAKNRRSNDRRKNPIHNFLKAFIVCSQKSRFYKMYYL
jgi:hypothetical protein